MACAKAPALKKKQFCDPAPKGQVVSVIFLGHISLQTELDRCINQFRSAETDIVFECLDGADLYPGGMMAQPAVMASAVNYLNYCIAEAEHYGR